LQQLRGSYVMMDLPEGFEEDKGFPGVVWPDVEASILITELPADAYNAVSKGLLQDPDALAEEGIELDATLGIDQNGHSAVIGRGRQLVGGHPFAKWLLLVQAPHVTLLVTAQAPLLLLTEPRRAVIEETLASIRISETRSNPREALPFVFESTERFVLFQVVSNNSAVLLERGPFEDESFRPLFAIGSSLGGDCTAWANGRLVYAEQIIRSMQQAANVTALSSREEQIGSDPAVATEAEATWDGKPVALFQTIRFRNCQYLRTIGIAPLAEAAAYRQEFAKLVAGIDWRAPASEAPQTKNPE